VSQTPEQHRAVVEALHGETLATPQHTFAPPTALQVDALQQSSLAGSHG
jgi:hypothetical protein